MAADPILDLHLVGTQRRVVSFSARSQQLLTGTGTSSTGGPARWKHRLRAHHRSCTLGRRPARWTSSGSVRSRRSTAARLRRFSLFTLTDKAERDDDCANIYHKSLLYLVSNALESRRRIPIVRATVSPFWAWKSSPRMTLARRPRRFPMGAHPNTEPGSPGSSGARHHSAMPHHPATLRATPTRILAGDAAGTARLGKNAGPPECPPR